MFSGSAQYYDKIYGFKDYALEAAAVREIIERYNPGARTLLEVACGTGRHLSYLKAHYQAEGLDIDAGLLEVAQAANPGVTFHHEDMVEMALPGRYDVVTCLFSSIGYVRTLANLQRAVAAMARHLNPGGLLVVEPWLAPEDWEPGHVGMRVVEEPGLKIVRVDRSWASGRLSVLDMHYLVARPDGICHFTENHQLGLFTEGEMRTAFRDVGLQVHHEPQGLSGRGLYIGVR